MTTPNHIVYLELPAVDIAAAKQFYAAAFGWTFEDFGPAYAVFHEAGLEGGINAEAADKTAHSLPVLLTPEVEAMTEKVVSAGGKITMPIFQFPGGRRFHFTDPAGNELAAMQPDAH